MTDAPRKFQISNFDSETYWVRPSKRTDGVENAEPIYTAVGRTLSSWENVEEALTNLFLAIARPPTKNSYLSVSRAFGSMMSNSARRSATEAAADIYFSINPTVSRGPFNQIIQNVTRASKLRDDAAHGRVSEVTPKRYLLMPPSYNSTRTAPTADPEKIGFETAAYRYNAEDLEGICPKFDLLAHAIGDYITFILRPS
jgi:hypothetical protein